MTTRKTDEFIRFDFGHAGGKTAGFASSIVVLIAATAAVCSAQSVTSAHSGTLHYFEGDVSVDNVSVQSRPGRFSEVKEQSVLCTAQGRAEVLLTPGVFLRVGENSAIKMLDNRLISTRVAILSGTVIVESDDPQMSVRDSRVTLIYRDYAIRLVKHGLVEISSNPAQMKVYKGEAVVDISTATGPNDHATVGEGRRLPFSAALAAERFNDKSGDDLYLWTRDRSQSLSAANMSSAYSLSSIGSGYGNGFGAGSGFGPRTQTSGWYFNQFFGMYTFVPAEGTFWNPWGYGFFSAATICSYYAPSNYWYGGGGARGTGSIGRPLSEVPEPTRAKAAPLSSIRSDNSGGLPMPGFAVRRGAAMGSETVSSVGETRAGSAGALNSHASAGKGGTGGHGH